MTFRYDPKDAVRVWPEGEYAATITRVEEKTSKSSGNPMLAVTFTAYSGSEEMMLTDYIVNPSTLFKLKKIADALGCRKQFDAGTFDLAEFLGHSIGLRIECESQEGYDDRNVIRGFVKPLGGPAQSEQPRPARQPVPAGGHEPISEEDIPF